jgi:hypothetical protein
MDRPRVVVSPEEFEAALVVWLRTLPAHVWARYAKFEKLRLEKRDREEDRVDPRDDIARHLAGKLAQANWEVSYDKPMTAFEADQRNAPKRQGR